MKRISDSGIQFQPAFLRAFDAHYLRKIPFVFPKATIGDYPSWRDVYRVLVAVSERMRTTPKGPVSLFVEQAGAGPGGSRGANLLHTAVLTPHNYLPRPEDGSLHPYLARLRRQIHGRRFGMQILTFETDWTMYQCFSPIADQLHEVMGMPAGGMDLVGFLGDYRRSPFGIHKDSQDVITFVVKGRKRMLVWPLEAFSDRPEVKQVGSTLAGRGASIVLRDQADYSSAVRMATVLDGQPGDVMYWPASAWHIADVGRRDSGLSMTITLGVYPAFRSPLGQGLYKFEIPERIECPALKSGPRHLPRVIARTLDRIGDPGVRESRRQTATMKWLAHASGSAFRSPPEPSAAPKLNGREILQQSGPRPIMMASLNDHEVAIAANGHSVRLALGPAMRRRLFNTIRMLNTRAMFPVHVILDCLDPSKDQHQQRKGGQLIELLVSWRALQIVEGPGTH
jgi:hypothetical protein